MDLNICRICGGIEDLRPILEHDHEMVEKLSKCANIHIDPRDSLPKLICAQCVNNLDISYRLRKQSEKTQQLLIQKLEMNRSQHFNAEVESLPASLQVDTQSKEEESLADSFNTLNEEYKTKDIKEYPEIRSNNDDLLPAINLESDTENQSEYADDDDIYEGENNVATKQFETTEVDECTIDLLSLSSRSEKSEDINDEIECNSSSYTCDTCENVFSSKKDFFVHLKEHGKERYQCIQCCKFFPTPYRLKRHEEVHSDNISHQCSQCERSYRVLENLRRHVRTVHLNGKSFHCDVCNISFSRKDVLKRHMLLHSDEKNYNCNICSQSFKTKDYLNAHYKSRHEENDVKCKKSNKRILNDTKKHQCGYCGKLFKSVFTYKNHILIHTNEKPHECETCKKKFRTIAALSIHQRVHDDYRPYQCDVCLKSFKQTSHLQEHKLLHLENVPKHMCSVCQLSFSKKSNLKVHMKIHETEKPFKCAECTAEFTFIHLLQQHANKIHNRKISENYDTVDLEEEEESNDDCNTTFEYDAVHFINTLPDGGVTEEFISENQKEKSIEFDTHEENKPEDQQQSYYENQEEFIDCIHIESSNSVQSLPSNEMHNVESICREEIHITEHKVEVFVNEETKFSNTGYDLDQIM